MTYYVSTLLWRKTSAQSINLECDRRPVMLRDRARVIEPYPYDGDLDLVLLRASRPLGLSLSRDFTEVDGDLVLRPARPLDDRRNLLRLRLVVGAAAHRRLLLYKTDSG